MITHVFFDLDHTLWDYETNAIATLSGLYRRFELQRETSHGLDRFIEVFFRVNDSLWQQYNQSLISRDDIRARRFDQILAKLGIIEFKRKKELSEAFLFECPRGKKTISGAFEILAYLKDKYHLSIVTNGFDDVQSIKLESSGLNTYFTHVFTSENTGYKKPDPRIFDVARRELNVKPESIIMIGDNQSSDILGANNANIKSVFFDPSGKRETDCQTRIKQLSELRELL